MTGLDLSALTLPKNREAGRTQDPRESPGLASDPSSLGAQPPGGEDSRLKSFSLTSLTHFQ